MNILITGGDKPLGKALYKYLNNSHKIFLMTKETLDISNKNSTLKVISKLNPDIVIHCDGLNDIELCEQNENLAYNLNTIGCLNTAYSCCCLDIPIVYISTNYVHDGKKNSPYYETDDCNPINVFGKTNLAAEKLIQTLYSKFFIIRTGWVFGEENDFIEKILDNIYKPIFMCSTEIGSTTYIEDLCMVIEKIISTNLYGTYNCVNPDPVSKSVWVKYILKYANINKEIIEIPSNYISNSAPRPSYCALKTVLLKNCFNIELPSWQDRTKIAVQKFIK
ncbi:NAD(P)-dependent oxidoreductase [Clostridium aestuarii]|uniref:dTDP-4-dehydrorhamnose reductase n=1 Tax=Clostridium aestuarii TaxID=338193 RepID=A0ABT4D0A6_9CLOT|nr:NAD(P)-dependent oxidoreductase [Clostridium aestuarii]MCY6484676.1 NAD(P)-dependent oxidoreductase [Clostridium aestuarii]